MKSQRFRKLLAVIIALMMIVTPVIPAMAAYDGVETADAVIFGEYNECEHGERYRWNKFNAFGYMPALGGTGTGFNWSLYYGGTIRIWFQVFDYGPLPAHIGGTGYRYANEFRIVDVVSAYIDGTDDMCGIELGLVWELAIPTGQTAANQVSINFGRNFPQSTFYAGNLRGDNGVYGFPWTTMALEVELECGHVTVVNLTNHFNPCTNCYFDDCCDYCMWQVCDFCEYCGECIHCSKCPVFGLNVFNNGTIQSQSIENRVRMWSQINGVNALAPYAPLEITATLLGGDCGLDFVSVNRIHNNLDYFNFIDVFFGVNNTEWAIMYVTVSVFGCGDPVEVRLVNPHIYYEVTLNRQNGAVGTAGPDTTTILVRNGQSINAAQLPNYTARTGFYFAGWYLGEYPGWEPMHPTAFGPVYEDGLVFTATFGINALITNVDPNPVVVKQGGTASFTVTTQDMPDGAWIDTNLWLEGLSVVGGPRFYIVDNQAVITIAAAANAPLGSEGFSVVAREEIAWGQTFVLDSYLFVIEVLACDPCPDCGECVDCSECLVFRWDVFNNGVGPGAYPTRFNASIANVIRMWTGFGPDVTSGNRPVPLHVAETIVAIDQDGNDVTDDLVSFSRMWVTGEGFVDYINQINVNKHAPWQRITLTIAVCGEVYTAELFNSRYFSGFDLFNNGPEGCPSTPNESLADAGLVRMWPQLNGVTVNIPYSFRDSIVATIRGTDNCAVELELIRVNRMWDEVWLDYFINIDAVKTNAWEFIDFGITVFGQTRTVVLHNGTFEEGRTITFNFPGMQNMIIQYWSGGTWHTLAGGPFNNSAEFSAPGATVVRAVRDGLVYSHVVTVDGDYVIDAPVIQLYVRGVPVGGNTLGVVGGGFGSNWVYNGIPAEVYPDYNSFTVFNNRAYEVRLMRTGFFPLSRMSSEGYDDGYEYLYVDLSAYLVYITVPEGVSNVRMQSNGWIVNAAQEGDVIWLVVDHPYYRNASVTFDFCCYVQHEVNNFILDGHNPLYIVCCNNNGSVTYMVTVTFDAGYGTGTMDDVTRTAGYVFTLPDYDFDAPGGYEFYGWFVEGYASPTGLLMPDDEITIGLIGWTTTVTVTAVWTPINATTATVTFLPGDGYGTMDDMDVTIGALFTLPANEFNAPEGYVFYGWWISGYADPLGTWLMGDDPILVEGPVTALALWVPAGTPSDCVCDICVHCDGCLEDDCDCDYCDLDPCDCELKLIFVPGSFVPGEDEDPSLVTIQLVNVRLIDNPEDYIIRVTTFCETDGFVTEEFCVVEFVVFDFPSGVSMIEAELVHDSGGVRLFASWSYD